MEKLEKKINEIVSEELDADELPVIHSAHEGWAFLFEEQAGLSTDFGALCGKVNILWDAIRLESPPHEVRYEASMVKSFTVALAVDAIRVAVQAEKLLGFMEDREGREDE